MTTLEMWKETPGLCEEIPVLEYYPAAEKKTAATVVIFPGGGYCGRADHEGKGYAEFLNSIGMDAFVCEYRVEPHRFPLELLDARRAIRFVRAHADEYGIDPDRVAAMGSSAGGHLSALVANYTDPIDFEDIDEIDRYPAAPDATILCYSVLHGPDDQIDVIRECYVSLLGERTDFDHFAPDLLVSDDTPPAFIWHTAADPISVINSYQYAAALRRHNIPHEVHVFPYGGHGLGTAPQNPHVGQWTGLLKNWFIELGWLAE